MLFAIIGHTFLEYFTHIFLHTLRNKGLNKKYFSNVLKLIKSIVNILVCYES